MLDSVAFIAFAALTVVLVASGLRRPTVSIEFGPLAGIALSGTLLIQALGILQRPETVPEGSIAKTLFMCSLTALAVYLGWRKPARSLTPKPPALSNSPRRLFWLGVGFSAVGLIGCYKLTALSGGVIQHFSTGGHYELVWSGLPVAYVFFMSYLGPGIFLTWLTALRLRSVWRFVLSGAVALVPLAFVIFLGRRGQGAELGVTIACALFFARGVLIPRAAFLMACALAIGAIHVAPMYRTNSQLDSDWSQLKEIDARATLSDVVNGKAAENVELYNAAWTIHITDEEFSYGFGTGIYNFLVAAFVPRLIFGDDFKNMLFIEPPASKADWQVSYGGDITGPAAAYKQFWYFGCLWFYALTRLMRAFFDRAIQGGAFAQVMYVACLAQALQSVVKFMYLILNPLIMFGGVVYIALAASEPIVSRAQRRPDPKQFAPQPTYREAGQ